MSSLRRSVSEISGLRNILSQQDFARYILMAALNSGKVLLERKLTPVDSRMSGTYEVAALGARIRLPCGKADELLRGDSATFSGIREMFGRNVYLRWFREDPKLWVNVVDAGGNRGLFTVAAALKAKRVVWIEEQRQYVQLLDLFLDGNRDQPQAEVIPVIARLAAAAGLAEGCVTLDEVMRRSGLTEISLLKMDIEGGEFDVFSDSSVWINSVRNITMEVHPQFGLVSSIVERLTALSFEVLTTDAQGALCHPDQACYLYASTTGSLAKTAR